MGEKFWIQDFETQIDRLRVDFITEKGQVKSIVVVQYEAYIDGQWRPIVRFDEVHGFFHLEKHMRTNIMAKINRASSVTDKNLARLTHFLMSEMEHPSLAAQIPNGAHIFHGTYDDMELTYANIKMAATMLIEMALGVCEDAPLIMLFEYKSGQQTVIDLSTEERKHRAQGLLEAFQEQSKQEMVAEINELLAV